MQQGEAIVGQPTAATAAGDDDMSSGPAKGTEGDAMKDDQESPDTMAVEESTSSHQVPRHRIIEKRPPNAAEEASTKLRRIQCIWMVGARMCFDVNEEHFNIDTMSFLIQKMVEILLSPGRLK